MTTGFIWNYKLPSERIATDEESKELLDSIDSKINQENGKYIYVHKVFLSITLFNHLNSNLIKFFILLITSVICYRYITYM